MLVFMISNSLRPKLPLTTFAHFTQESCPNFAFFINDSVAFLLWVTLGELQWEAGQIVLFKSEQTSLKAA